MARKKSLSERAKLQQESNQVKWRTEKLHALHEIGTTVVSALELEQVLNRVIEAAVSITEAEEGTLLLVEQRTNELYVRAQKGLGERQAQTLRVRVIDSAAGSVFETGKAVRLGKEVELATGYTAKSLLCVPLIVGGHTLGVLCVYNRQSERVFTEEDEYLLATLANYAAIAISNADIFSGLQETADYLERLVNNSPNAILAVNRQGFVTTFNEGAEQIMGYAKEEVLGKFVADCYWGGLEEAKKINLMLVNSEDGTVRDYETFRPVQLA